MNESSFERTSMLPENNFTNQQNLNENDGKIKRPFLRQSHQDRFRMISTMAMTNEQDDQRKKDECTESAAEGL
jgi:hypothetical protein